MPAELNPSKRTVLEIAADLADGRTTSRELVEAALAQITDPAGEGKLGHIRAADHDGAGRAKARNDRSIALRPRTVVKGLRSGQGSLARYVEEVLQGNR